MDASENQDEAAGGFLDFPWGDTFTEPLTCLGDLAGQWPESCSWAFPKAPPEAELTYCTWQSGHTDLETPIGTVPCGTNIAPSSSSELLPPTLHRSSSSRASSSQTDYQHEPPAANLSRSYYGKFQMPDTFLKLRNGDDPQHAGDVLDQAKRSAIDAWLQVWGIDDVPSVKVEELASSMNTTSVQIHTYISAKKEAREESCPTTRFHQHSGGQAESQTLGIRSSSAANPAAEGQASTGGQLAPPTSTSQLSVGSAPAWPSFELTKRLEKQLAKAPKARCNEERGSTSDRKFKCTFCRNITFDRKDDWKRHEMLRLSGELWVCRLCPETQPVPSPHVPFVHTRKDKLRAHIMSSRHSGLELSKKEVEQTIRAGHWATTTLSEHQCGWGDHIFASLRDRFDHIEDHFNGIFEERDVNTYVHKTPGHPEHRRCVRIDLVGLTSARVKVSDRGSTQHHNSDGDSTRGQATPSSRSPPSQQKSSSPSAPSGARSGPLEGLLCGPSLMIFDHHLGLLDALLDGRDKLRFIKELGRGDHGRVIKVDIAGETRTQSFALKKLNNLHDQYVSLQHFRREVEALAKLKHPSVVRIIAASTDQSQPRLAMLPVAETDLNYVLEHPTQHPQVRSPEILRGFVALATGLLYLHSAQILHNDIKPSNILVDEMSLLYTDFGSSTRQIKHGSSCRCPSYSGSPAYAAPEIKAGEQPSEKSDVYSLGMVFFEMLLTWTSGSVDDLRPRLKGSSEPMKSIMSPNSGFSRAVRTIKSSLKTLQGQTAQIGERLLLLTATMIQGGPTQRPNALEVTADLSRLLHVLPPTVSVRASQLALSAHSSLSYGAAKRSCQRCPFLRSIGTETPGACWTCWTISIQQPSVIIQHRQLRTKQPFRLRPLTNCCSPTGLSTLPAKLVEIWPNPQAAPICRVVKPRETSHSSVPLHYLVFANRSKAVNEATNRDPESDLSDFTKFSRLPYAMQEAVKIASTLGISYLWTEEYCGDTKEDPAGGCIDFEAVVRDAVAIITMSRVGAQGTQRFVPPSDYLQTSPPLSLAAVNQRDATIMTDASSLSSVAGWLDSVPLLTSIELPFRSMPRF